MSGSTALKQMETLFSQAIVSLNSQLIAGRKMVIEPVKESLIVRYVDSKLVATVTGNLIEVFLVTDGAQKLKFSLQYRIREQQIRWSMNNRELHNRDVSMMVLSSIRDLAYTTGEVVAMPPPFRLNDLSLTGSVRKLIQDKQRLLVELIEQEETFRTKLAAELHDGALGDILVLKRAIDDGRLADLNCVSENLAHISSAIRHICESLSLADIDEWGLANALYALVERLQAATRTRIVPQFSGDLPSMSRSATFHLYRVIQECLNNALKHSSCSRIELTIKANDSDAEIIISDDGKGFDNANTTTSGFGLRIVRERVALISEELDHCSIDWQTNGIDGCTVTIALRA